MTIPTEDRLVRLVDERGVFRILALDHRDSLRVVIDPDHPERIERDELCALKRDLVSAVSGLVSGVMLDPEVGMDRIVVSAVPAAAGIIAALEAQGYLADESVTHTTILDGWSPAAASGSGADAVKLLALWTGDHSEQQERVIGNAVAAAHEIGMPLVLEPLPRGLPPTGPWVVDWAKAHRTSGADVFKLPYPGSADRCEDLTRMLPEPWVLLSAGAGFEEFEEQLQLAMAAGAAGYIVGRAVWREAASLDDVARRRAIDRLVLPRLESLAGIPR